MRVGILTFFSLLFFHALVAQQKPYFQQSVRYSIDVRLDDKKYMLHAKETLVYVNNSPDQLTYIWFHLWPNAYSGRETALAKQQVEAGNTRLYFADDKDRGWIDSLQFKSEGQQLVVEVDTLNSDICKVVLLQPLAPGDSVVITTPFRERIPSGRFSRGGHIGQAFAITQWYPKPAVYDREGWHPIPYLDQGEFYSEFGTYDVRITLPQNYVVGATGDLIDNPEEVAFLASKVAETEAIEQFPKDNSFPPSDSRFKTLHFHQERVHDFAWFADKRFHVVKDEAQLSNGHTVTTWAMFTNNEPRIWKDAAHYVKRAIEFYSDQVGNYPYNHATVVDGTISAGGGMEYPNITIVGESGTARMLDMVIAHEVGHNWFYGLLGSNEREHPWMDEGMNSYVEYLYELKYHANDGNAIDYFDKFGKFIGIDDYSVLRAHQEEFRFSAIAKNDQAPSLPATAFSTLNYGTCVYSKTGLAFQHLHAYVGDAAMKQAMHAYYDQWSFKHPSPADVRTSFEQSTNQNLDWLFEGELNSNKRVDYGIRVQSATDKSVNVRLHQKGDLAAPIPVVAYRNGEKTGEQWIFSSGHDTTFTLQCTDCDRVALDPEHLTLDVFYLNNQTRTKGLLKTLEAPQVRFLTAPETSPRTQLFWLPAIGWNNYNKWMGGVVLHNYFGIQKRFEFSVAPLASSAGLAGTAEFTHRRWLNTGIFIKLETNLKYRQFGYAQYDMVENGKVFNNTILQYKRLEPSLSFYIRNNDPRSTATEYCALSGVWLWEDQLRTDPALHKDYLVEGVAANCLRFDWALSDSRAIDPYSMQLRLEGNADYVHITTQFNYHFNYGKGKRGVDARLFGGTLLSGSSATGAGLTLTDRRQGTGSNDYTYDEYYFGRSETTGILWQQMVEHEGALKAYSLLNSMPYNWVAALKLSADFPGQLPLQFFADFGTADKLKETIRTVYGLNTSFTFDAGISVRLIPGVCTVYLPFLVSDDIKAYNDFEHLSFKERIRFTFDIKNLNPVKARNKFY